MDKTSKTIDKLVQLARIGATGDSERLRIQAMRLIHSLKKDGDPVADKLQEAIFSAGKTKPSTRALRKRELELAPAQVPTDSESGSELLLIEDEVTLPNEFICDELIASQLQILVDERNNAKKLNSLGMSPTKTVLFTGAPGVGKTMAARKIAMDLHLPLYTLDLATVISSFLGKTGTNLKSALEFAEQSSCVLLLDELDAIAKKRDDISDVGEMKRIVTVILQELDRWPQESLLISATNHLELIDTAVRRRFDQVIDFPMPNSALLFDLGMSLVTPADKLSKKWIEALSIVYEGASFSDFTRELNRLRRLLVISSGSDVEKVFASIFANEAQKLDIERKKKLTVCLIEQAKLSQRAACRITGLARDTIRKEAANG